MRHKKYETLIVVSYYDEIASDEKGELERHLASCSRCATFKKKLDETLPERGRGAGVVSDAEIARARMEFRQGISIRKDESYGRRRVVNIPARPRWSTALVPVYAAAMAAVVMLAAGAIFGYLLSVRGTGDKGGLHAVLSEVSSNNTGNVALSDLRFLTADQKNGDVQFSFDLVRRYQMRGSLDDREVQKVLAYALVNSDNPGIRLTTIGMLDASAKPDRQVVDALVEAVKTDDNAGVRREALLSLAKLPFDNVVKAALLYVLQHDKNPGMRVAAINILSGKELNTGTVTGSTKGIDTRVLEVLKERSSSDQNRYVRLKAADMLKEFKEL